MKHIALILAFSVFAKVVFSQKIDRIYVNLYTDSLKKGTYNYINIEGSTPDGMILPLDTNHLTFSASSGDFFGNSLWLDPVCDADSITVTATLKQKPTEVKTFVVYLKRNEDTEELPSEEDILRPGKKRKN